MQHFNIRNICLRKSNITEQCFGYPVIAFATDTVYGLGCVLGDIQGLDILYRLKQRPMHQPMQLLVSSRTMAEKYVILPPGAIIDQMSRLYLQHRNCYNKWDERLVCRGKVSVRTPMQQKLIQIITKLRLPLVATSANKHGSLPILDIKTLSEKFPKVPIIVTSNQLSGQASIIWDMTCQPPKRLR